MESLKELQIPDAASFKTLIQEFKLYEANGKRTSNLQQLLDAVLTIKPSSTQNERNFSIATDFITKKRTRMLGSTLNALCFLKNYLKKN